MAYTVTVDARDICIGHRLKSSGRAEQTNYHGHTLRFSVTCSRAALLTSGELVDAKLVEALVGGYLEEHWDHAMLLERGDPLVGPMRATGAKVCEMACAPTIENLARLAFSAAEQLLKEHGIEVLHVACIESDRARAGYAR